MSKRSKSGQWTKGSGRRRGAGRGSQPPPIPQVQEIPENGAGEKKSLEKEAYEKKKEVIAQLRRMGYSFRQIGAHPDVQLSKSSAHIIFEKMLQEGIIRRRAEHVEIWREEKLEELRELKKHAYETFVKSRDPAQEEREERIEDGKPATVDGKKGTGKYKVRKSTLIRGRDGSVHALQLILDIVEKECHLLGILKPDEIVQHTQAQVNFFLPVTRRNKKEANAEYEIPKPKETTAIIINNRPPPSELVTVERSEPIPGSEEAR